jgi:hypothetical protein
MEIDEKRFMKAKEINQKKAREKEYIKECIKAKICPACGGDMKYISAGRWVVVTCNECEFEETLD